MDRGAGRAVSAPRRLALLAAAIAAAAACTDLGPEGGPASIEFDSLPYPSVVLGDSLRTEDGVAAPLFAFVFDLRNRPLPDVEVRFTALDSGIEVEMDGFVEGETFGTSHIVAQVGQLQSIPTPVIVTRRPDQMHATVDTEIPVEYSPGEVVPSTELAVRVVHDTPPEPADTVVPGWIVRYEVVGQAPGDTVPGYLVNGSVRASADTTDASGLTSLRFRLNSATLPVVEDTVEVRATARHLGMPIAGSPVTFLLLIRPRPTS